MRCAFPLFALVLLADCALAEDTNITVRVVARNAQYVGDLVHGALITITDAASGEMLAQGTTSGNAGNPKRTMETPRKRGEPMAAKGDAKFTATLDIDEPRYLQVTVYGPLNKRFSQNRASATQWVVPGKHLTGGDGWVLELPGLLVSPNLAVSTVPLSTAVDGILINAEVMLMCGCPIKPGFYWDPEDYEVIAIMRRGDDDRLIATYELMALHVDMAGPRAAPFAAAILARLRAIETEHAGLPTPKQAGGSIGMRAKQ